MPGDVLFIGHSLVGPVMPRMVDQFFDASGLNRDVDYHVINGAPLKYNWENSSIAQGVDARAVLPRGGYDTLILTEALPLDTHLTWSDPALHASYFAALARDADPAAQIFIYETWHSIGGDPAAWRRRLDEDLSKWEGIADGVDAILGPGGPQTLLIPAGQAMARLYDAIEAGEVPGLTSIEEVIFDGIHLNDLGQWFIAALQATTLAGLNPAQLPLETTSVWGTPFGGPGPATAAAMSEIITATLSDYGRDGWVDERDAGEGVDPTPDPDPEPDRDPEPDNDPEPVLPIGTEVDYGIGLGLSGVTDWTPNLPLLDVFKTSRPFFGHIEGRWGGMSHEELAAAGIFDADGWPLFIPDGLGSIGTLILTEFPAEMTEAAGRYHVTWQGSGTLRLGLSAENVIYGENEAWFDYQPNGGGTVSIQIFETDPLSVGDNLRAISVVKEEYEALHQAGQTFNPLWLDIIDDGAAIRFMDWMGTNGSTVARIEDLATPSSASWSEGNMPLEVMIALANQTGTDPWFNIPHLADAALIRHIVETVRDSLDPSLTAYFEYSNEVWNFQFEQALESYEASLARFPGASEGWMQVYAARAVEMARIIDDVFEGQQQRVVKVIGTQKDWEGLERAILEAPNFVAEDPVNNDPPYRYFDAYAITGYFDGGLGRGSKAQEVRSWIAESLAAAETAADRAGLVGTARDSYIAAHRYDLATERSLQELRDGSVTGDAAGSLADLRQELLYHSAVADQYGLDLVAYEGGTHVVGTDGWLHDPELAAFFTHLNYTPGMGELYGTLFGIWEEVGGHLFNAFTGVDRPTQFGSWGHLRHLNDSNPRMDALREAWGRPTSSPEPDPLGGEIWISGLLQQGEELQAELDGLDLPAGVAQSALSLQWLAQGQEIAGATGSSLVLTQALVDTSLSLRATFAHPDGTVETVQSVGTGPVTNLNDPVTGDLLILGQALQGEVLTVSIADLADIDGIDPESWTFTWFRDGTPVPGNSSGSYTLNHADVGAIISVTARFKDGFGTVEEASTATQQPVININDFPVGRPLIAGNAAEGQRLLAVLDGIADADGILPETVNFQWLLDDSPLRGENGQSLLLDESHVGHEIRVTISYQDGGGANETVLSAPTQPVRNEEDLSDGQVTVSGIARRGEMLSAQTNLMPDAEGIEPASLEWSWILGGRNGSPDRVLDGRTDADLILTEEFDGAQLAALMTLTDQFGNLTEIRSAFVQVNAPSEGYLSLLGDAVQGQTLDVDLANFSDPDGIDPGSLAFQWYLGSDPITGATDSSFALTSAEVGSQISLQVSYMDGSGFLETLNSDAPTVLPATQQIFGSEDVDLLRGTAGQDVLFGLAGDDLIFASHGDDRIDGGEGFDAFLIEGSRSTFTLRIGQDSLLLTDRRSEADGGIGEDSLKGIETISFVADPQGAFPVHLFSGAGEIGAEALAEITELYIAYFNRAPDALGLTYWAARYNEGFTISQMVQSFFEQPETEQTYASFLTPEGLLDRADVEAVAGFVETVYQNVLGRSPDAPGLAYWVGQLGDNPAITPANFILSVIGGAKYPSIPTDQTTIDQSYLATKADLGLHFAITLGMSDIDDAALAMGLFDGTSAGADAAMARMETDFTAALNAEGGDFLVQLIGLSESYPDLG